ncbi:protein starmaker isoform X2 [Magallana gigas]
MPKKDDIWKDIPSTEKIKSITPPKSVNDFTKVTNRYNADRYEIFEDGYYDSDDIDEFINDEEESDEESDETPHPSRIKGYRRRLLPKNSDSDSEESDSCQPLQNDSADEGSLGKGSSKVTEDNGSRSNSPLSGLKLKKTKYKSNVIESSDSDTEVEENDNDNKSPQNESCHNLGATANSNNSPSSSIASVEQQSNSDVKAFEHTDSGAEVVITESDEELSVYCASVEKVQGSIVVSSESSESESSSGCESEAESDGSGSETEEELQKHDRAYRQRQQKQKKFEEFKQLRKNRQLSSSK